MDIQKVHVNYIIPVNGVIKQTGAKARVSINDLFEDIKNMED
jgi:hypothetical protein